MENSKIYRKIKNETFTIEKAIERLKWRFKNENVKIGESKITINELDVKAVEFLTDWINRQKLESLNQNTLLAKFVCYTLDNEIEFYKDVQFATNKLNEIAKADVEEFYKQIFNKINNLEYLNFCKEVGIVTDHIESMTLNKSQQINQNELIKTHKEKLKQLISGTWSEIKIYKSLNNLIYELINKYKKC